MPIFGSSSHFERDSVIEEGKTIWSHIVPKEAELIRSFDSRHRLRSIDKEFIRWRNVGCQLCYAHSGDMKPDHLLKHCNGLQELEEFSTGSKRSSSHDAPGILVGAIYAP